CRLPRRKFTRRCTERSDFVDRKQIINHREPSAAKPQPNFGLSPPVIRDPRSRSIGAFNKHPKPDRRDEIAVWEARAERSVAVSADLEERARQVARQGIPALDAAHLASAEAGGAEIVLTCDDVVLGGHRVWGSLYGF